MLPSANKEGKDKTFLLKKLEVLSGKGHRSKPVDHQATFGDTDVRSPGKIWKF